MRISDSTVALVTGGASGLGFETARTLHDAGASVLLVDLPSSRGDEAAAQLGERAAFCAGDVTSEDDVLRAVEAARQMGDLRILVNCAGVATPGKMLGKEGALPLKDFEKVIAINLLGTFNVCRLVAQEMASREPVEQPAEGFAQSPERGVIINTASVAAFDGQIGQPAYAASKGAVAAMTLPLARELARPLIRVMTIAPGIMETPMLAGLPQAAQDSLGQQVPHPARLGKPAEYAQLVRHIVENPLLNGETIRLDGAIRMAPK